MLCPTLLSTLRGEKKKNSIASVIKCKCCKLHDKILVHIPQCETLLTFQTTLGLGLRSRPSDQLLEAGHTHNLTFTRLKILTTHWITFKSQGAKASPITVNWCLQLVSGTGRVACCKSLFAPLLPLDTRRLFFFVHTPFLLFHVHNYTLCFECTLLCQHVVTAI